MIGLLHKVSCVRSLLPLRGSLRFRFSLLLSFGAFSIVCKTACVTGEGTVSLNSDTKQLLVQSIMSNSKLYIKVIKCVPY